MSNLDDHFVTLLAQSSKLIKQATSFLSCDDDGLSADDKNSCLLAMTESNEAMLGVSEKLLERKIKRKTDTEKEIEKSHLSMNFPRSNCNITFDSIIGSPEAKLALYENLILPLSMSSVDRRKIFQGVLAGGGNVLLYGPPGTGKTCLAQAAACEANAELFAIRPSEILRYSQWK